MRVDDESTRIVAPNASDGERNIIRRALRIEQQSQLLFGEVNVGTFLACRLVANLGDDFDEAPACAVVRITVFGATP